jgi:hypothetical protein
MSGWPGLQWWGVARLDMATSTHPVPRRIFISYRRQDAAAPADWLFDLLSEYFGTDQVVNDIDSIEIGADSSGQLAAIVESSGVILAVIGKRWLTVRDQNARRRLDDPSDYVRVAIETALERGVRVIPILVDGAQMPPAEALPTSLAPLAHRDALELRSTHLDADIGRLMEALGRTHPALAQPSLNSEPISQYKTRYPGPQQWESSQPIVYDDLIRRFFAEEVQPGRLLFNPPEQMRLGETERVEVRLTRTLELDDELRKDLRGHGEPQLEEIDTAPLMAVKLKGDGFLVTAYSDEEQSVFRDRPTTWEFDIRAKERGQQRLILGVSLRVPAPGQPTEHRSIPVREVTIDVQVGKAALVGHFVSVNWRWLVGTAIAVAAVVVAAVFH